jgi:hypothetical protein
MVALVAATLPWLGALARTQDQPSTALMEFHRIIPSDPPQRPDRSARAFRPAPSTAGWSRASSRRSASCRASRRSWHGCGEAEAITTHCTGPRGLCSGCLVLPSSALAPAPSCLWSGIGMFVAPVPAIASHLISSHTGADTIANAQGLHESGHGSGGSFLSVALLPTILMKQDRPGVRERCALSG